MAVHAAAAGAAVYAPTTTIPTPPYYTNTSPTDTHTGGEKTFTVSSNSGTNPSLPSTPQIAKLLIRTIFLNKKKKNKKTAPMISICISPVIVVFSECLIPYI